MTDSERFRIALERIARVSPHPMPSGDAAGETPGGEVLAVEMARIAHEALEQAGSGVEDDPGAQSMDVLIQRLKKTTMTTTERLLHWKPQLCALDELLELRAAARALRAEYAAHKLEIPTWLPKAESGLDDEITMRSHRERLRRLEELKKEREALRAVEERKVGLDQQIACFEASLR